MRVRKIKFRGREILEISERRPTQVPIYENAFRWQMKTFVEYRVEPRIFPTIEDARKYVRRKIRKGNFRWQERFDRNREIVKEIDRKKREIGKLYKEQTKLLRWLDGARMR